MSMINIVNEAINRKLASISFTNIVRGVVVSVEPLAIKINDRITIGPSFIDTEALGVDDNSPSQALPLIVGESVQMIRYNNGQRFYILGSSRPNFDQIYPVGTLYQNTENVNPNEYFGLDWVFIGEEIKNGITIYNWVREEPGDKILLENGTGYLLMENGGKILWQ